MWNNHVRILRLCDTLFGGVLKSRILLRGNTCEIEKEREYESEIEKARERGSPVENPTNPTKRLDSVKRQDWNWTSYVDWILPESILLHLKEIQQTVGGHSVGLEEVYRPQRPSHLLNLHKSFKSNVVYKIKVSFSLPVLDLVAPSRDGYPHLSASTFLTR